MAINEGRIGPNAILQMIPVLDRAAGQGLREEICAHAGLSGPPDGSEMIPEAQAAHLHRAMRYALPDHAPAIAWAAGLGTADYILAHRIPAPAQHVLNVLPAALAAPLLARAISRHAWTFCGSGTFARVTPWCFEIADNPFARGEAARAPICDWHRAVFTRLYLALVVPGVECRETACCATGSPVCRFELQRGTA